MKFAVYNPHNRPEEELPVIYGFNNGGRPGLWDARLLAEDGTPLGAHACSSEFWMYVDLGIVEGYRSDRHETFRKHYPDGYRMDFVHYRQVPTHAGLMKACKLLEENSEAAEGHR